LALNPRLFAGFGHQSGHARNIGDQLWWNVMPVAQILRTVIRDPDFSIVIFPDENLERQVDGGAWSGQHYSNSSFGTPEDQQLGRWHLHPGFFHPAAVLAPSCLRLFGAIRKGCVRHFIVARSRYLRRLCCETMSQSTRQGLVYPGKSSKVQRSSPDLTITGDSPAEPKSGKGTEIGWKVTQPADFSTRITAPAIATKPEAGRPDECIIFAFCLART